MTTNIGFTDIPISSAGSDTLGIRHYLEGLASFILRCETPLTISIQGEWGTGKTSAMNIIKESIEENVPTVWFNTWQFSQFSMQEYLPVSLLAALVESIGSPEEVTKTLEKVWLFCSGAAKTVAKGASMIAMEKVVGGAATELLLGSGSEKQANESTPLTLASDIRRLKENLTSAVHSRLSQRNCDRLVLFIDDLDRLEPYRAVELLEVLKNFLDVPGCVFVLAVDHGVVEQGIKTKLGLDRLDRKGRSFFDKIIQMSFNLPVAQYNTQRYVHGLLDHIGLAQNQTPEDINRYVMLIATSVDFNPRGIKRVFNLFQLLQTVAERTIPLSLAEEATKARRQQLLFALLCMQTSFPELYIHLALKMQQGSLEWEHLSLLAAGGPEDAYPIEALGDSDMDAQDRSVAMRDFMKIFNLVMDIDGNGTVSDSEMAYLGRVMTFSSITQQGIHNSLSTSGRGEQVASFSDLGHIFEDRGLDRSLALSIYDVLDQAIERFSTTHQKPYRRNITANAVVSYNLIEKTQSGGKGRKAVAFLYTYAQAGGVAVHIGKGSKLTLRSISEVNIDLINSIFDNYDAMIA